jgi:hypothetical protein
MILPIQKKIELQMDKELDWIVEETCSILFARAEDIGGVVKRGVLIDTVARVVAQSLLEREPEFAGRIDAKEFDGIARDAICGMTEETLDLMSSGVAKHVAEMCVAYWELRKMGMRTTYETRRDPMSDYNPFGNDGGFCNPMKLKMLYDG